MTPSCTVAGTTVRALYQPYFDACGHRLDEGELLCRPVDGSSPDAFFHGLSASDQATVVRWQGALISLLPTGTVAVNIHNRLLSDERDRTLFLSLTEAIRPSVFEFTEAFPMPEALVANRLLRDLRSQGHRAALDDFGTGLNGVSLLTDYDFDIVKIDRSTIGNLPFRPERVARLRLMREMLGLLGKRSVVEGVEDSETYALLVEIGFTTFQGFHFAQAINVEDMDGGTRA